MGVKSFLLLLCCVELRALTLLPTMRMLAVSARSRQPVCKKSFQPRRLAEGDEWDGIVSKHTDFGAFVRLGGEQHMGLLHIRDLSDGVRMQKDEVQTFVEETVGPVGSKVRVKVAQLEFKGAKRVSLKLLSVIKKQRLDDVVFAPGPGRLRGVAKDGTGPGDPSARLDEHESVPF
eukprot:CAMPEP_0115840724 /NCGR_PEP_ID=MMETSP0287-20121206/6919_1 /TAXON_ID=412157 /ORGANISM="Chrysochromulina rotalis, Strain UIO044" /LENGTH=174 /DNA_ID=CAMNT_0003294345 /DNA_START=82 /DNA_END=606 /DNA_ORIENTATION=-